MAQVLWHGASVPGERFKIVYYCWDCIKHGAPLYQRALKSAAHGCEATGMASKNKSTDLHVFNSRPRFEPAPDAAAARWVSERVQGFAESVVSIVPAEFPAYARIYHPAWHTIAGTRTMIRWSDVARAAGRVSHRQMQWPAILGGHPGSDLSLPASLLHGSFEEPRQGSLPPEATHPLRQLLAAHTTTPKHCWFAVWEGWGCLNSGVRSSPAFDLPNRRFHLFQSSIEAIELSFCAPPIYAHQSANLWWPEDRAWCVATEIDFMTTYVAGSAAAIAALIACDALEVDSVEPTDGVTWASDTLNPLPGNRPQPGNP